MRSYVGKGRAGDAEGRDGTEVRGLALSAQPSAAARDARARAGTRSWGTGHQEGTLQEEAGLAAALRGRPAGSTSLAQHPHLAAATERCQEPPAVALRGLQGLEGTRPRSQRGHVPPTGPRWPFLDGSCPSTPGGRWSLTPPPWNHVKLRTPPRIFSGQVSDLGAKHSWPQPHVNSIFRVL